MYFFPALRAFYRDRLSPFLPADPLRIVLGSGMMAILAFCAISIGGAVYDGTIGLWHRTLTMVDVVQTQIREWEMTAALSERASLLSRSAEAGWLRGPLSDGMSYSEGGASGVDEAVRRCDYALVQAIQRIGLTLDHVLLLQKERHVRRDVKGGGRFPFQRIAVRGIGNVQDFVTSLEAILGVFAKNVTVRLVERDGRSVVRLMYDMVKGARPGTVTHEVFLYKDRGNVFKAPERVSPQLSIIVTGLGADAALVRRMSRLKLPLTAAVIPNQRQTQASVNSASSAGFDVFIHQPMEGAGLLVTDVIRLGMPADQSRAIVRKYAELYAAACGIMNYGGGLVTASPETCKPIAEEAARCGLMVVDAMAHPSGELAVAAKGIGLASWRRTIALAEGEHTPASVIAGLRTAEKLARENGSCIATLEASADTMTALETWAEARDKSVSLVLMRHQVR